MESAKLYLLVDHSNIPWEKLNISKLISAWIAELRTQCDLPYVLNLIIRAYGGWYSGGIASAERYRAAEHYQRIVPSALKAHDRLCKIRFEFADTLAALPSGEYREPFAVRHTVVPRSRLISIGWKTPRPTCHDPNCKIKDIHRWLHKNRACTSPTCPHSFSDFFERLEQKQVDVHLATDLLLLSLARIDGTHLGVLSDDIDFIPSLVAAKRYGNRTGHVSLLRCNACPDHVMDMLRVENIRLIEIPSVCTEGD
jgi:uncharacterized LabA/DUF88 family protein